MNKLKYIGERVYRANIERERPRRTDQIESFVVKAELRSEKKRRREIRRKILSSLQVILLGILQ